MIDLKFKSVKVRDWIWTIQNGYIRANTTYKKGYHIAGVHDSYTEQGLRYTSDKHPSAWTYNPFDLTDKPPCEFKKGEVICVRNYKDEKWCFGVFDSTSKKDFFRLANGIHMHYARKLTSEEKGE